MKESLLKRKSSRTLDSKTLSLEQISTLLYFSAGLKTYKPPWHANRFHPSAGSRYSLEVYLISLNTELGKSVFHYNIKHHSLELLSNIDKFFVNKYFGYTFSKTPPLIIILSAVFSRVTIKYQDRSYRYILSETGNISQNFYLLSAALNLGCSTIGYIDDEVNKLLDLDGLEEAVVYSMAFGSLPKTTRNK